MGHRSHPAILAALGLAALALTACGQAGGTEGGADNLPSAGLGPFSKAEEPLLSVVGIDYRHPISGRDASGQLHLFAVRRDVAAGVESAIERFRVSEGRAESTGVLISSSDPLLGGEELGALTSSAGPLTGSCLLFGPASASWIAKLDLTADLDAAGTPEVLDLEPTPATFEISTDKVSPVALAEQAGQQVLYVLLDERALGRLVQSDGQWRFDPQRPLLVPSGEDPSTDTIWDRDLIRGATLRRGTTATGRIIWRLWYTGGRSTVSGGIDEGIGFAGSFDGITWIRAAANPLIRVGSLSEKDAYESFDVDSGRLVFSEFWKPDGANRHVIRAADLD